MSFPEAAEIDRIRERLEALEKQFEREMRARGFEPDQVDRVALTTPLAKLHTERCELRARLATLTGDDSNENE
jgi:hypothetical protein